MWMEVPRPKKISGIFRILSSNRAFLKESIRKKNPI